MKKKQSILKGNRKFFILIFLLIILIGIYFFVGCFYSFSKKSLVCYGRSSSFKRVVRESICTVTGGFSGYSRDMLGSREVYSCIKPYSDYGEPCNYSNECEGECEYVGPRPSFCYEVEQWEYNCAKGVQGTCSPKSYGIFNGWNEVSGNRFIVHPEAIM